MFEETLRPDDVLEQVLADVRVHRGQGVVQQVDVGVVVHGTRQTHALLLTTADVDTLGYCV